jgi:hypothetical protein
MSAFAEELSASSAVRAVPLTVNVIFIVSSPSCCDVPVFASAAALSCCSSTDEESAAGSDSEAMVTDSSV